MRGFSLLFLVSWVCCGHIHARAGEVLTPAAAGKHQDSGTPITVELVVDSCHPIQPDGKFYRLYSGRPFKDQGAFAITLSEEAIAELAIKDVEEHFLGQRIRATGKVTKTIFNVGSKTIPGIYVDKATAIELLENKK